MKDLLILLLLVGLLWGGYEGMTYLSSLAQSEKVESDSTDQPLADNLEKRLNQSAIKEMKKGTAIAESEETPAIEETAVVTLTEEKTNGQKAMDAVRATRLDIENNSRDKEDFYTEVEAEESTPYQSDETAILKAETPTNTPTTETDLNDHKAAMAEKGKALAGEFRSKSGKAKKAQKREFNIEKGEIETPVTAPTRPQEYEQPAKKFIPSKFVLVAGSFSNTDNAVQEVLRLQKQGYPKASIVLSENNLNLISLGSFADRATANAQAAQIKKAGIDLYVKGMR